ncbi:alpha/beta hydrolase [Enterobacteriaceae bacterium YMB-R22]|jgi:pimeloyl-ACP methyl ester carboxylesterase|uniref:alpha/beta fold hydrolase n=1 Tax=Tenebrionicola larvae TaxID=2815733 RepID=UPI002010CBCD|nr:alpha/beta hydrolase [Tenebrionicola larvae]MBV4412466.1 alpha/beta hydrolase [Tenebrionicola larvae]
MSVVNKSDATLYYEVTGEGFPVIFLHGGGGNTLCWFQQVPFFSQYYKVITVDLRGFKNSRCDPACVHTRYFPDDLRAVMDAEGIDRAALVCQSLGAWAGLPLAVSAPERVASLFITGSPTPAYSPENWQVLKTAGDTFNQGKFGGTGRNGGTGWNRAFLELNPELFFLYSQIKRLNGPFDACTMQDEEVKLYPRDFASYRVPTLIGGGSHDDFLTPDSHKHVATLIPGAEIYTFENAGHSPYYETPEEYNKVLYEFLRNMLN